MSEDQSLSGLDLGWEGHVFTDILLLGFLLLNPLPSWLWQNQEVRLLVLREDRAPSDRPK